MSYFTKTARPNATGEMAKWNGWPIDDDDRMVLARLWKDLPALRDHATSEEVEPYLARADSADLDWSLGVVWTNPSLIAGINRLQAEKEHRQAIITAIRRRELTVVAPNTRLPTDEYRGDSEMSVEELRRYAAQFKILVRFEPVPDSSPLSTSAVIAEQATLWSRRQPAKLFGDGFGPEMQKLTTLSKYLAYDTWTPEAAAMLVCGIQAPIIDGQLYTSIPEQGAMGLDNGFLMGSQDPFHEAKRLLGVWYSQESPPARIRPLDFIKWCQARGFDTSWLRSIEEEMSKRTREDMKAALGSGVVVLPSARPLSVEWLAHQIAFSLVAIPDDEQLATVCKETVAARTRGATCSILSGEDWRLIRSICGNPPVPCSRSQFEEWSGKFAAAENKPEWSLVGDFKPSDEMAKAQARWSDASIAHGQQIAKWLNANHISLLTTGGVETSDTTNGLIRTADVKRYLDHYNLAWREAKPAVSSAHTSGSDDKSQEPREIDAPTARELSTIGLTVDDWQDAPGAQRERIRETIASTKANSDKVARQALDRQAGGRFTLNEAARQIADSGERFGPLVEKLCDAARRGDLPTYGPGESARYVYGNGREVRPYYEEAHWGDLNSWLAKNEPKLAYRFFEPSTIEVEDVLDSPQSQSEQQSKPLQRHRFQEQEIVRVIRGLGHDPAAIPKWQSGKSGIKAAIRAKLPEFTDKVFEKAWERLRKDKTIKDVD